MNILQITYANQQPQTLAYKAFKNADEAFEMIVKAKRIPGATSVTVIVTDDFDRKMLVDASAVVSVLITSMENEQKTAQAIAAATPRGLVPAGGQHMRFPQQ